MFDLDTINETNELEYLKEKIRGKIKEFCETKLVFNELDQNDITEKITILLEELEEVDLDQLKNIPEENFTKKITNILVIEGLANIIKEFTPSQQKIFNETIKKNRN